MKNLLLSLFLILAASPEAGASALPSCRTAWSGQKHEFDFKETYASYYQRLQRSRCEKEWAVLVYMAADNNLFPYALWDLFEMEATFQAGERAGSTLKTDLLVQVDGTAPDDLRRLHIHAGPVAWKEKRKSDFENENLDQVRSPIAERLQENKNETEQQRLEKFIKWAVKAYPAKQHMLIVWGHGQGWKSFPAGEPTKPRWGERTELPRFPRPAPDKNFGGIAFRESSGTWLDIPALRSALETFQKIKGNPVDVYASDACLMQMTEVAYQLSPHARFLVGSAQVQSYLGLPYRRMMYELNTGHFNGLRKTHRPSIDGNDEPYLLAKMLPPLMKQSLDPRRGLQGKHEKEAQEHMTSSALGTGELENLLVPAVTRLSASLKDYLLEDDERTMEMRFVSQSVPTFEGGAQDFGVFLGFLDQLLLEEKSKAGGKSSQAMERLQASVAETKQTLDKTVQSYAYGSAYGIDQKTMRMGYVPRAVSVWMPVDPREYHLRKKEFSQSRFWKETGWGDWLELVFGKEPR